MLSNPDFDYLIYFLEANQIVIVENLRASAFSDIAISRE